MTKPSSDKANLWFDPVIHNLELLRARYTTQRFAPHMHDTFAIGVVETGALSFRYPIPWEVVPAGQIMIIHPGEIHSGQCIGEQGVHYRMLYPDTDLLQGVATELTERPGLVPSFSVQAVRDDVLAHRVLELHRTLEDPETPAIERESRLLWVLAQLIAQHADGRWAVNQVGAERPYVKTARDYLNVRYADDITLRQLAAAVNISPFHLLRTFKGEVGVPPHIYLTQLRVKHAKRLLQRGLPTAEVAAETGFCDQSQLTKRFKQFVGVTPGQYRQSQQ